MGAGACTPAKAGPPTATTCSGCNASRSTARTRSGWSSPTTAAGWPRAAPCRCTSTAPRLVRAGSRGPCRCCSPPMRPPTSAATAAPRSATTTAPRTAASAAGCAGSRSTWTSTTTTTSSAPRSASGSPWPDSNRHEPGQGPWPPCFPSAATGYTAAVADGTLPLTVQESPGRVRLWFGSLAHGDGPTLQDAADDLVQRLLTYAMAFRASGLRPSLEMAPPDLAAMDLLYQLGELAAT